MGYKRRCVFYELLKPNQTITVELLSIINRFKSNLMSNNSSKKTQSDFVARQCSITRCRSN